MVNSDSPKTDAKSSDSQSGDAPGWNLWPGLLFAMLGSQVVLMLVMVYMATSDRSFAVEPDYYRQALRWDEIRSEQRASTQLGWSAEISVSETADMYKNRDIACTVTDQNGHPIGDATVDIIAFSHARGSERTALTLDPDGQGKYHGHVKVARAGVWEFRIVVRQGNQTFTQVQEMRIDPTEGSR